MIKSAFGINDNELNWFGSYLTNREQVCCVNNYISSRKTIKSGVPPGINSWSVDVPIIY